MVHRHVNRFAKRHNTGRRWPYHPDDLWDDREVDDDYDFDDRSDWDEECEDCEWPQFWEGTLTQLNASEGDVFHMVPPHEADHWWEHWS